MTTHADPAFPSGRRRALPLSPERVRTTEFNRTVFGRRGYNEDEVRLFLGRLAEDISASDAEKANLRAEIDRLRNWYRQQGVETDTHAGSERAAPTVAAVNALSEAQQAADAQVAQAEEYARRLVGHARQQYEDIIAEAQRQAEEAAQQAVDAYRNSPQPTDKDREQIEHRIAYLRTFAEVTHVQLRSVLEALTREVDKIGKLPDDSPFLSDGTRLGR